MIHEDTSSQQRAINKLNNTGAITCQSHVYNYTNRIHYNNYSLFIIADNLHNNLNPWKIAEARNNETFWSSCDCNCIILAFSKIHAY